jgi:mono/diheme cytochrome c family protein
MMRVTGAWVLAAGMAIAGGALANTLRIELPKETATLKRGPGADVVNAQCLICHSAEYITTQPPDKPLAFWKAEVEKMKKVYGAPVPDEQIDLIAEYLARNYGSGTP